MLHQVKTEAMTKLTVESNKLSNIDLIREVKYIWENI